MKKIFKFIILLYSIIILNGCTFSFKDEIINAAKNTCEEESCSINVSDIVDFQWDEMYIFNKNIPIDTISEILGFKYTKFSDIGTRVIFVKNKSIIYQEEYFDYPEKKDNEVLFLLSGGFEKIIPEKAILNVQEINSNGYNIFYIRPEH